MGRAVFSATDPNRATDADLNALVPKIHGVAGWDIGPGGEVFIEYDETTISPATIEEALAGLGFQVQHKADDPRAGNATATQNTTRGASGPSSSPGDPESVQRGKL